MVRFNPIKLDYSAAYLASSRCTLYLIEVGKTGACPGFLKGGGPISLGSLKKGHQILKGGGGSNGLKGRVQYICLTLTTNLAYLDAKE